MRIAIIDYGMGNLRNVEKAFRKLGYEAVITEEPEVIRTADKVVLPGVGAFCQAIETLRKTGLDQVIREVVEKGTPLLGICLGMQLLFEESYENGHHTGLGLIEGKVVRFDVPLKIPHMGWNTLTLQKRPPLFEAVEEEPYVYFVHSYHVETDPQWVSATTEYGKEVVVAVQKGHVYGMQYHPEKSSEAGLLMLKAFAELN
ncbi:MAG: imidazole glycerol phosphate synthase subunit HisH [Cellulosilyticaceae bacterium]